MANETIRPLNLSTATTEPVLASDGMRSAFRTSEGHDLSVRYNQGDVDFPIVAASAAADVGSWLVIGLGTHVMIRDSDADKLRGGGWIDTQPHQNYFNI